MKDLSCIGMSHYLACSDGHIYSTRTRGGRSISAKRLKPYLSRSGYYTVSISVDKVRKTTYVHRIVASAFLDNSENLREVNHINGIKTDNRVDNLQWCGPRDNVAHAIRTGLRRSKLNEFNVLAIKTYILSGYTDLDISKMFNIKRHYVNQLRGAKYWKSITSL